MKRILILSPHTDDAEIACGGSMLAWARDSEVYHTAFSACEENILKGTPRTATREEFARANKYAGVKGHWIQHDYPVRDFAKHRAEIARDLGNLRRDFHPDLVVGPSLHDCHQDHRVIHEEMIRIFRRDASILCYEMPRNDLGFVPQAWKKISSEDAHRKVVLVSQYASQVAKKNSFMDADSILAALRFRGQQVNAEFAEAFETPRWILD